MSDHSGVEEIVVVPHTHWDREWYEPFQRFRLRLVALLDDVFDRMAADPRQRFTLDGQMAAVDDYLEVRPHRRDLVAELVRSGRLAVGPWQILLDEFLCSGENVVRNLERGLDRAEKLGGAVPVGYLPDMFGHIAQMPQILAGAGLAHACVFRGVPADLRRHVFAWRSPDGTAIRTEYLPGGYGNAAGLVDDPAQVARRARDLAAFLGSWGFTGVALGMYGTDHAAPAVDVADLLEAASGASGPRLRLGTLTEYFDAQPISVEGLPVIAGELRSHARANILPGVISVRTHLKRAMGRAERQVERYAEPMAALWHDGRPSLRGFLDMAWQRLIDCSCHDSVTGCGCDETAQQVAARLAEADQLGRAVVDLAGARLAAAASRDGYAVFNPSPFARTALVTLDIAGTSLIAADGTAVPTQVLEEVPTLLDDSVVELGKALRRVHGVELYGQEITRWEVSGKELTFHVGRHGDPAFDVEDVRLACPGPLEEMWRVRILAEPRRVVAAAVTVPALGVGFCGVAGDGGGVDGVAVDDTIPDGALSERAEGTSSGIEPADVNQFLFDNGLLRVGLGADGTLELSTPDGWSVGGVGRIVDGGDVGDSYNYASPEQDRLVAVPDAVRVRIACAGPLLTVAEIERDFHWPVAASPGTRPGPWHAGRPVASLPDSPRRSAQTRPVTVTTRVELRTGEPFARLRTTFDNRCDDHRVRLHLPLAREAASSFAEGQFAVVERGLTAEGGGGEFPLPTFPANGFVAAGGLAILLTQPTEYELADNELAVTLLRSIGMLSRNRHVLRDEPAGPQLPTPEAQCHGEQVFDLAVMPYSGDWHSGGVLAAAETYRHGFLAFAGTAPAGTPLPQARAGIRVEGEGVVVTSVRDRDGRIEVRFVAEQPHATEAVLSAGSGIVGARTADLRGRTIAELPVAADGTVRVALRAYQIATVQLELRD
ncbi:MAG: alpha-mannosidase [Hamadaea sp.]|nr:alpha-mannosidase [Hamadaea sp.]